MFYFEPQPSYSDSVEPPYTFRTGSACTFLTPTALSACVTRYFFCPGTDDTTMHLPINAKPLENLMQQLTVDGSSEPEANDFFFLQREPFVQYAGEATRPSYQDKKPGDSSPGWTSFHGSPSFLASYLNFDKDENRTELPSTSPCTPPCCSCFSSIAPHLKRSFGTIRSWLGQPYSSTFRRKRLFVGIVLRRPFRPQIRFFPKARLS
jgi:hypothetical protein